MNEWERDVWPGSGRQGPGQRRAPDPRGKGGGEGRGPRGPGTRRTKGRAGGPGAHSSPHLRHRLSGASRSRGCAEPEDRTSRARGRRGAWSPPEASGEPWDSSPMAAPSLRLGAGGGRPGSGRRGGSDAQPSAEGGGGSTLWVGGGGGLGPQPAEGPVLRPLAGSAVPGTQAGIGRTARTAAAGPEAGLAGRLASSARPSPVSGFPHRPRPRRRRLALSLCRCRALAPFLLVTNPAAEYAIPVPAQRAFTREVGSPGFPDGRCRAGKGAGPVRVGLPPAETRGPGVGVQEAWLGGSPGGDRGGPQSALFLNKTDFQ